MLQCWIFVIFIHANTRTALSQTLEDQLRLQHFIEGQSHKHIRPVWNQSETLEVTLRVGIISILDLDEKSQVLYSMLVFMMEWKSETLSWNTTEMGGCTEAITSPSEVWTPNILLVNTVDALWDLQKADSMKITISSDGFTTWNPIVKAETQCRVNVRCYPFDTQVCSIMISKTGHADKSLVLRNIDNVSFKLTSFQENNEWRFCNSRFKTLYFDANHSFVCLDITLQRYPLFHILNEILPVIILSIMNLMTFYIPVSSGERVGYCVSVFLSFIVLLNMISELMPKVSENCPFIQIYIEVQIISGMLATLSSILLLKLSEQRYPPKFMRYLHKVFNKKHAEVGVISEKEETQTDLKQKGLMAEKDRGAQGKPELTDTRSDPSDKLNLIQYLDKLFFWLFFFVCVTSSLACGLSIKLYEDVDCVPDGA